MKQEKVQKFFKLRFKPLDKFYIPARGYKKNNLSSTGKTYSKKSINFGTVSSIYVNPEELPERKNLAVYRGRMVSTEPGEWEWVEYIMKAVDISEISTKK